MVNVKNDRKLVSTKNNFMIFIKINRRSWTLLYMCYVVETYVYMKKAEKKPFSTELCMICQEKIVVPKKVDKRHKTLNVSS